MQKIELSIGTNTAFVNYNDEKEKENLILVSKELNKEYNKLVINIGRVDETILLIFLLIKTESKINKINYKNSDEVFDNVLKSIGKWINSENEKIKVFLVLINIIRKIELERKTLLDSNDEDLVIKYLNNFTQDIKAKIETIEKNILLS